VEQSRLNSFDSEYGPLAGSYENGNESSGSIPGGGKFCLAEEE
jgi:hypothetical protein